MASQLEAEMTTCSNPAQCGGHESSVCGVTGDFRKKSLAKISNAADLPRFLLAIFFLKSHVTPQTVAGRETARASTERKSVKIATFDATVAGEFKKLPSIIVDEKNFNDKVLYLYL